MEIIGRIAVWVLHAVVAVLVGGAFSLLGNLVTIWTDSIVIRWIGFGLGFIFGAWMYIYYEALGNRDRIDRG